MKLIKVNVLKEWIENWFTKNRFYHPYAKNNNIPITELYDILEQMPSAQPERKKGEWKAKEERKKQEIFICSECGGWAYSPWIGSRKSPKPNRCKYAFCPNCGCKTEG